MMISCRGIVLVFLLAVSSIEAFAIPLDPIRMAAQRATAPGGELSRRRADTTEMRIYISALQHEEYEEARGCDDDDDEFEASLISAMEEASDSGALRPPAAAQPFASQPLPITVGWTRMA
jgi:hypothetical protein